MKSLKWIGLVVWCGLMAATVLGADDRVVLTPKPGPEPRINGARVAKDGDLEVWAKDREDGSKAVGLFNRGGSTSAVTARWKDLGVSGSQKVRDLWRQKDVAVAKDEFRAEIPSHGCLLVRMWKQD